MITKQDKKLLTEAGKEYLLDIAIDSQILKDKLTFKEHLQLCNMVMELTYEEVIALTITESIRDFEKKFGKFLKYSFAAIAGMKWIGLLKGPPIAMFILYVFRKATDTCNRECIKKFPFSIEKRICKLECKIRVAKRITADLRSEVNKCSQFERADKCEKSLRKEYIKWAKRLQDLLVRLNQEKTEVAAKKRKEAAKAAVQRAKAMRAHYQIPKKDFLKIISENQTLREKLPFRDHIYLYYSLLKEEEYKVNVPKINPEKERIARRALYLGLWIIPIPFFNDLVNYLIKKYSASCMTKCLSQKRYPKEVCYNKCSYLSAKYAVEILEKNLKDCHKAKKPEKCRKKTFSLLRDWKQREVERKIKFESSLRAAIQKARRLSIKK